MTNSDSGVVEYSYDGVVFRCPMSAMNDLEDLLNAMRNTAPDDGGPSGECCEDLCEVCLTRETVIITVVHTIRMAREGLLEVGIEES